MRRTVFLAMLILVAALVTPTWRGVAIAAEPSVNLGTAGSFAVLAGSTVTNTGATIVSGDLGVSPGTAITGFPPGMVINGTQHASDPVADIAQSDLTAAYNDAAGRAPTAMLPADLGGMTLVSGVYAASSSLGLTGTVTLDGEGDPTAVFIFQVGSTLITASNSTVALTNGAQACNVFWQVGSSATLGVNSTLAGTAMSLVSTTVNTGTVVVGRILARTGAVTLDQNVITRPDCAPAVTPTSTTTTTAPSTQPGGGSGDDEGGDEEGNGGGNGTGNGSNGGSGDGNGGTGTGGGNGTGSGGGNGSGSNGGNGPGGEGGGPDLGGPGGGETLTRPDPSAKLPKTGSSLGVMVLAALILIGAGAATHRYAARRAGV